MKHVTIDDTVWPIDDDGETQWRLRYGIEPNYGAASILAAYAHLIDPSVSQRDACAALKRARRARLST